MTIAVQLRAARTDRACTRGAADGGARSCGPMASAARRRCGEMVRRGGGDCGVAPTLRQCHLCRVNSQLSARTPSTSTLWSTSTEADVDRYEVVNIMNYKSVTGNTRHGAGD